MLPLHIVVGSIKSVIAISDGPHALARLLLWRAGFLTLTLTLLRGIRRHGGFWSPIGPFLIGERSRSGREAGVAHLSNIWVFRAHVAATVVGTQTGYGRNLSLRGFGRAHWARQCLSRRGPCGTL